MGRPEKVLIIAKEHGGDDALSRLSFAERYCPWGCRSY